MQQVCMCVVLGNLRHALWQCVMMYRLSRERAAVLSLLPQDFKYQFQVTLEYINPLTRYVASEQQMSDSVKRHSVPPGQYILGDGGSKKIRL